MHTLKKVSNLITYRTPQKWSLLLILAMVLLISVVFNNTARAAVALVYFRATGVSDGVFLEWETASELDNLGFFVNNFGMR